MAYLILAIGVIPSAFMFYYASQSEYRRFQFQARIASGWYNARVKTRQRFHDEELSRLLRRAGFKMKASTYHYVRLVLSTVLAALGILLVVSGHVLGIVIPVIFWLLMEYRKPFPMYYGFILLQKQASSERNRDLYLLYRLMLQEILVFQDHPIGVHEMLRRQLNRVSRIRPFLERCLDSWMDDPGAALKQFGEDLGTKQAETFAHMLTQIAEAGVKTALDLFETNHESFREDRIAAFRAQLNTRALIGTVLTMVGFGAVSYDLQVILQIYSGSLLKTVTG